MDVYTATFGTLVVFSSLLAYYQHSQKPPPTSTEEAVGETQAIDLEHAASSFKMTFLPVYLFVMASDWLQGPFIYTLYKDEKELAENVVAALFTTGFVSAAVSATFVGSLADKYGRRLACLIFCGTYALSCITVLSSDILILFCGRLLGGLSTTLMYSVFEGWMVAEYYAQQLDKSTLSLSSIFGSMTTFNGVIAIISGVVGESIVTYTRTKTSPFMASIVCLGTAFCLMLQSWGENYGDSAEKTSNISQKSGFKIVLRDARMRALALVQACFEGSMYLFVFFWSAALKSSHAISHPDSQSPLPFGLVFATFMAAMMIGSMVYSLASSAPTAPRRPSIIGLLRPNTSKNDVSSLLASAIAVSAISLLLTVLIRDEKITFWCFCLFEACIGVYFPSMGEQRGHIVDDGVRAKIYGIMRIPLNVFVVVALSLTQEGDAYREMILALCSGLLILASIAAKYYLETGDGVVGAYDSDTENRLE